MCINSTLPGKTRVLILNPVPKKQPPLDPTFYQTELKSAKSFFYILATDVEKKLHHEHHISSGQHIYQAFNKGQYCALNNSVPTIWLILWCLICLQAYPGSQRAGWVWAAVSWLSQLSVAGNADRWDIVNTVCPTFFFKNDCPDIYFASTYMLWFHDFISFFPL